MAARIGSGITYKVKSAKMGNNNGKAWQMILIEPNSEYGFPAKSKLTFWNNDPTPLNAGDEIVIDPTKEWYFEYRNKSFDGTDGNKVWYFDVTLTGTFVNLKSTGVTTIPSGAGINVSTNGWTDGPDDGELPF